MSNTSTDEKIGFRRRAGLSGVEVRDVENSARRWRGFSTGFEFVVPRTWEAEVRHRRRRQVLVPGMMFSAHPEEVFTTPRVLVPGTWSALTIDSEVFHRHLAEHGIAPGAFQLRPFVVMSEGLRSRMLAALDAMAPAASLAPLEAAVVELVAAIAREVVERVTPARCAAAGRGDGAAAPSRLSRFQILRMFKDRYGLPPHAYQLRVRIGLAQRALRAGSTAADVAAAHGFVDQSHFSRRFKQLVGVTPSEYVRGSSGRGGGGRPFPAYLPAEGDETSRRDAHTSGMRSS